MDGESSCDVEEERPLPDLFVWAMVLSLIFVCLSVSAALLVF